MIYFELAWFNIEMQDSPLMNAVQTAGNVMGDLHGHEGGIYKVWTLDQVSQAKWIMLHDNCHGLVRISDDLDNVWGIWQCAHYGDLVKEALTNGACFSRSLVAILDHLDCNISCSVLQCQRL